MKYTIIVTVYNKEKYLERCLNNICNQNYDKYEILVINDGSTDNSEQIIKKYKKKYKFKYIKKENTGISDTRNIAIKEVKTDYFLFVDADDYISKDLLTTIDKYNDYDLLSFTAIKLNENMKYINKMYKPAFEGNGEDFFIKLVNNKCEFTVPWGYIYNTKFFQKNEFTYPKGEILEDFYLTPFIIMNAQKVISLDYVGYYYLENKNSIINNKENKKLITTTYLKYYKELISKINNSNYKEQTKTKYTSFLAGILLWQGGNLEKKEQTAYINKIKKLGVLEVIENKKIKKLLLKLVLPKV